MTNIALAWDAASPVAEVCRALFDDLGSLTVRLNDAITNEVVEFTPPTCTFTSDERFRSTRRCTADFLQGVAQERAPSIEEVERRRAIGRQAVIRAFPLQPLIGSFHVAYRELWSELVLRAIAIGGDAPLLLLGAGSRVWEWMHATVNAVAEGYDTESARIEALESRATERLIELIARDDAHEETHSLAMELGLAKDAASRVVAILGQSSSSEVARTIVAAVEQSGGIAKRAPRGSDCIIIVQSLDRARLAAILESSRNACAVGVGSEVTYIEDLRCSLGEAERALELSASHKHVCYFEDEWLLVMTSSNKASVERMLEPGIRVGRAHPHLAEAIRVFADSLSMAEGARTLSVSHNSFRYRLMRWQTLTGWTPWTFDGLARSVVALDLAERKG